MKLIAHSALAICLLALTGCGEERSDIENLEPKVLEEEARALSESAKSVTQSQVKQIQPMDIDGVQSGTGKPQKPN